MRRGGENLLKVRLAEPHAVGRPSPLEPPSLRERPGIHRVETEFLVEPDGNRFRLRVVAGQRQSPAIGRARKSA